MNCFCIPRKDDRTLCGRIPPAHVEYPAKILDARTTLRLHQFGLAERHVAKQPSLTFIGLVITQPIRSILLLGRKEQYRATSPQNDPPIEGVFCDPACPLSSYGHGEPIALARLLFYCQLGDQKRLCSKMQRRT